jgi:Na+-transporting NADH:ubiquinone oxidoreductase subunit NqrB
MTIDIPALMFLRATHRKLRIGHLSFYLAFCDTKSIITIVNVRTFELSGRSLTMLKYVNPKYQTDSLNPEKLTGESFDFLPRGGRSSSRCLGS